MWEEKHFDDLIHMIQHTSVFCFPRQNLCVILIESSDLLIRMRVVSGSSKCALESIDVEGRLPFYK